MTTQTEKKVILSRTVAAIALGTVIDHLPPGTALSILEILDFPKGSHTITVGLNLPSTRLGKKDIIKIEGLQLSEKEIEKISIFAPKASVSFIEECQVLSKSAAPLPKEVEEIIKCPNRNCITNHETGPRRFSFLTKRRKRILQCVYCEHEFGHEEVKRC